MTQLRIAIDAMGGDEGTPMVLEGVSLAKAQFPNAEFVLFGDEAVILEELKAHPSLANNTRVVHTDIAIGSQEKPSQAVRKGRKSSMGLAVEAVKEGEADVAVSAGNTGAMMALSKIILRMMPGIDRPALATRIPTLEGETVMLDLGANVECDVQNLVQFAVMGSAFARAILGHDRPKVALLNVGVEDLKGNETVKEAAAYLKDHETEHMDFVGYVEGHDLVHGQVQVIVTDGFTGNVALKTAEGTAHLITTLLKRSFEQSVRTKLGYLVSKPGLSLLKEHLDPNNHNGAVFLGLNGLVVKSHGGTNAKGFANAIKVAVGMAQNDLPKLILKELEEVQDDSGHKNDDDISDDNSNATAAS